MSVRETKVWTITCDICNRYGGTVFSAHTPGLPARWSYRDQHDCGLTGYTRTDIICGECTERLRRKAEVATSEGER